MPARLIGKTIALKKMGHRTGARIERVAFYPSASQKVSRPNMVWQVNYKSAIWAVYRDGDGLFLELTEHPIANGPPLGSWIARNR